MFEVKNCVKSKIKCFFYELTRVISTKIFMFRTKNQQAKPYHEIPGPKELPGIGNSWRFAPIIGKLLFFFFNFISSLNTINLRPRLSG